MKETYHIERELQVISVEEVEHPWKKKCVELEVRIYDLESELSKFKRMGLLEQNFAEENRIIELEAKNRKLLEDERELREDMELMNSELDDWRKRYKA
jgi:hypothetical protein